MQKQIQKIEIALENCEIITVEGKHIEDLNIEDIKYSINRVACNAIQEIYTCSHFSLSIHRNSNLDKKQDTLFGTINEEERNNFNRILKCPDITSIYIYFTNQKEPKQIYMPWNKNSNYENKYQKSYINKFGDLFIVIDKEKSLESVYDLVEIEDKEYMDFIWNMYK